MFLSAQDAQMIADEVKRSVGRDINIMDEQGIIIASTDPARINQVHVGAQRLLQKKLERLTVHKSNEREGLRQGVNLPVRLQGRTVGVIGITGVPEEVSAFGGVIQKMTEIMVENIWRQKQQNQMNDAKGLFLENWLFSDSLDIGELEVRGQLLGIDVSLPWVVVMLQVAQDAGAGKEQELQKAELLRLVRISLDRIAGSFCCAVHQRILILLPQKDPEEIYRLAWGICQQLEETSGLHISGGISTAAQTCMALRQCYLEAKTACKMAQREACSNLIPYSDASLEFVVQSLARATRERLTRLVFSAASEEENREILRTLQFYFQYDGRVEQAAAAAFVHKNTFLYHLRKIQKLTHYDIRKPKDCVLLYLAMQSQLTL